ncbi:MAG: hypothetical protein ACI4G1_03580 [Ruminococcus sp.]
MKKIISIILAVAMIALSSVTAFAVDDSDLSNDRSMLRNAIWELKFIVVDNAQSTPPTFPAYSKSSSDRAQALYDRISAEISTYTTHEDFVKAMEEVDQTWATSTVCSGALKWLLNYVQKDLDSEGYYDDATKAQLVEIYNKSKDALENGTEEEIHCAFIDMYNEFRRLCIYNDVEGDVNGDGRATVLDISILQQYFAKEVVLNTSQRFAGSVYIYSDINTVSYWQKVLAKIEKLSGGFNSNISKMKNQTEWTYDQRNLSICMTDQYNPYYSSEYFYCGPLE